MLLSLAHKFLFVANVKTASSSIEATLAPLAEIAIGETRFGKHEGHHHYVEMGFVAGVEGDKVRLSANADIAVTLEEEPSGRPVKLG